MSYFACYYNGTVIDRIEAPSIDAARERVNQIYSTPHLVYITTPGDYKAAQAESIRLYEEQTK